MFTGIIEQKGLVLGNGIQRDAMRLCIQSPFSSLKIGESIAVNGVCLTLIPHQTGILAFDLSQETLSCTTLGQLKPGDLVNLERAMLANTRFGGHYVSGHVDLTTKIQSITLLGDYVQLILGDFLPASIKYLISKGSITVDGVSLTINRVQQHCIELMLVPHTLAMTTLSEKKPGDFVNIEFDYLARIIAHQLALIEDKV